MERKEAMLKTGYSTLFLAVMAFVLCAVPSVQAEEVPVGDTLYIDRPAIGGFLYVYGTANVDTGFYADYGIYAFVAGTVNGSTVNIQGGTIGAGYGVSVYSLGLLYATVTVYGTGFEDSNGPITTTQWTPIGGEDTLTGTYEDGDTISLLFYSDVPINLVDTGGGPGPGPAEISIDIKPGSYPNAINLGSNGVIPVAILSTEDFTATTIDPDTVSLAGSGVAVRGKGNKSLATQEDVNGDGLMDLVVKVETENLDPGTFQNGLAILQVIVDGTVIYEGSDEIIIVPPE